MNGNNFMSFLDPVIIQSLNSSDPSIFYQNTGYLPPTPPQQSYYQLDDQVSQIPNHNTPLINEIKDTNYSIEANSYNTNSRQCVFSFSLPTEPMNLLMTPSQSTETYSTNTVSLYQDSGSDFSLYPQNKHMEERCYSQPLSSTGSGFSSNSLYVVGYPSPCSSASPLSCYEPYPINIDEHNNNKKKTNSKKPYSCARCSKTFGRKQELQRHQVCHSKERNFPCTICSKTFARRDAMQRHCKSHSKIKTKKHTIRASKV